LKRLWRVLAVNSKFRKLSRRDFLRIATMGGAAFAIPALRIGLGTSTLESAYEKSTSAMGTTVSITIEGVEDSALADFAASRALAEIKRLLTHFPGGTQVYPLDQDGFLESPSTTTVDILQRATRASTSSGGTFDVTVEPVLQLLQGFLAGQPFPSDAQFDAARRLIDYEKVSVDDHYVSFPTPGMGITLDGIATGYILDQAVTTLKGCGVRSALLNIGGTLAALGSRADGSPWEIGITNPVHPATTVGTLHLRDQAVATSGDYENYFTADKSYYHVIDPFTARSPLYSHSATVVAAKAIEADQMGVVLMIESPRNGRKVADDQGCDYLICTRSEGTQSSAGMQELMR
jgi:thiamine biosynthesis lipoprotein